MSQIAPRGHRLVKCSVERCPSRISPPRCQICGCGVRSHVTSRAHTGAPRRGPRARTDRSSSASIKPLVRGPSERDVVSPVRAHGISRAQRRWDGGQRCPHARVARPLDMAAGSARLVHDAHGTRTRRADRERRRILCRRNTAMHPCARADSDLRPFRTARSTAFAMFADRHSGTAPSSR
jgi:hypothetical protein